MTQREISLLQLTTTRASGAVILIRFYVGLIFASEGILDMIGALLITKLPLLWGEAALYPKEGGMWDFLHESRVEIAMLCGSVLLFVVGAGAYSLDARMSRAKAPAAVS
jgi:hypothetical protein